jgi:mRNA interferase MazF
MIRGEIWWACLPPPRGSEPAKRRPVVILQGDTFNRSAINTVICAVITSNLDLASAPANLRLEKAESGLEKTSVINFSQIITINKSFLSNQTAMLPKHIMTRVNRSLKEVFDIS